MALRSPVSTSSHKTEGSVPASQPQPTYTTAGTIYNPNSSQPLQPPARRGRFNKWNSGLPPELSLLPKSMLSALPLHTHGNTRAAPPVQYSPLQQNYDRAVSPSLDSPKPKVDYVTAQTPRMFSANMDFENKQNLSESSDDEDEEVELRLKPLLSMPVKSLQNLASYPNPDQKRAQKVILRGVRSNLAANAVLGANPDGHNSGLAMGDSSVGRSESASLAASKTRQLSEGESSSMRNSMQDFKFVNQKQMRASLYRSSTDGSTQNESAGYTTLALGPGAPRPLTAGPPGQRQYRPSKFDTTFRALLAKDLGSALADGASSLQGDAETLSSNKSETEVATNDYLGMLLGDSTPCDPSDEFTDYYPRRSHRQASPTLHRTHYHMKQNGQRQGYGSRAEGLSSHGWGWSSHESNMLGPQMSAEQLTPEEKLRLRLMKVNNAWNKGRAYYSTADYIPKARTSPLGAVGERIPSTGFSKLDTRDEGRLSITEANRLSAAEHAKPLLELVLKSLERNLASQRFSTPDPSLIDESPEGNRSLFGKATVNEEGVW